MNLQNFLPLIPSLDANVSDIPLDWGGYGVCAYSTGSALHFANSINNQLMRLYSIDFRPHVITKVKFHKVFNRLAICDTQNRVIFWDVELRAAYGSASLFPYQKTTILDIQWIESVVLVLLSNMHLVALDYQPEFKTETLSNIKILWDLTIRLPMTRISSFSMETVSIALYGFNSTIEILETDSIKKIPKIKIEALDIKREGIIVDSQWSEHIRDFMYILTENELLYLSVATLRLIPLMRRKLNTQPFTKIIQFNSSSKKLILFHKNTSIDIVKIDPQLSFTIESEIVQRTGGSVFSNICKCYTNEDLLLVFVNKIGFGLLDIRTELIISILPTFPSLITCISSLMNKYAYGQSSGHIVVGEFDTARMQRYLVSGEPISAVFLANERVYWSTSSACGCILLESRKVKEFKFRPTRILKMKVGHNTPAVVQIESNILCILVSNTKIHLFAEAEIIDYSIHDDSSETTGNLAIICSNKFLYIYNYDLASVTLKRKKQLLGGQEIPLSISWHSYKICISFNSGLIMLFYDKSENHITMNTGIRKVSSLKFSPDGILFGIADSHLFCVEEKSRVSNVICTDFSFISEDFLFVLYGDGIPRIISYLDWKTIVRNSKCLPPPSNDIVIKGKLLRHKNAVLKWIRPEARHIWNCLLDDCPFLAMDMYCAGNSSEFVNEMHFILKKTKTFSKRFVLDDIFNYIFADDYKSVIRYLTQIDAGDPNFLLCATLSSCIATFSASNAESIAYQLREFASSLFRVKKYKEGSILMKIAKLDKEAVDILIKNKQYEMAKCFIRTMEGETKSEKLSKLAVQMFKDGNKLAAAGLFASARIMHPVLVILDDMGLLSDTFLIKKLSKEKQLLIEMDDSLRESLDVQKSLEELCEKVDSNFKTFVTKLGMSEEEINSFFS